MERQADAGRGPLAGAADLLGLNLTRCHPLQFEPMTADETVQVAASWTVGELAQATGLSQRVLRHWEELGLVTPARTAAGHRRYGPGEITRLYQALALRQAGLRLAQIKDAARRRDPESAATTLRAHLAELDADLHRRGLLRDRLAAALGAPDHEDADHDQLDRAPVDDAELLMKVIETMTMFDQYVHGYRAAENHGCTTRPTPWSDLLHVGHRLPGRQRGARGGCGVGAQTVTVGRSAARAPSSPPSTCRPSRSRPRASARTARAHATSRSAQADIFALPARRPARAGSSTTSSSASCSSTCRGRSRRSRRLRAHAEAGRHDHRHRGRPRLGVLPPRQRGRPRRDRLPGDAAAATRAATR